MPELHDVRADVSKPSAPLESVNGSTVPEASLPSKVHATLPQTCPCDMSDVEMAAREWWDRFGAAKVQRRNLRARLEDARSEVQAAQQSIQNHEELGETLKQQLTAATSQLQQAEKHVERSMESLARAEDLVASLELKLVRAGKATESARAEAAAAEKGGSKEKVQQRLWALADQSRKAHVKVKIDLAHAQDTLVVVRETLAEAQDAKTHAQNLRAQAQLDLDSHPGALPALENAAATAEQKLQQATNDQPTTLHDYSLEWTDPGCGWLVVDVEEHVLFENQSRSMIYPLGNWKPATPAAWTCDGQSSHAYSKVEPSLSNKHHWVGHGWSLDTSGCEKNTTDSDGWTYSASWGPEGVAYAPGSNIAHVRCGFRYWLSDKFIQSLLLFEPPKHCMGI